MKSLKLWSVVALATLVVIVVLQNTDPVTTRILWVTVEMPRVLMLATTLLTGVVIGMVAGAWLRRGRGES